MRGVLRRWYWRIFDRIAFSSTRALLGGRIRCFVVIAAPHLNFLPPPIVEFLATAFDCPVWKSIVIPEASGYATWCDAARDIRVGHGGNGDGGGGRGAVPRRWLKGSATTLGVAMSQVGRSSWQSA